MNIFSRLIAWIKSVFQKKSNHVELAPTVLAPELPPKTEVSVPVAPEPTVTTEKAVRVRKPKKVSNTSPSGDAPSATRTRKRKSST